MTDKLALGMLSDALMETTIAWIMKRRTARRRSRSRTITSGYSRRKNALRQFRQNGKWQGKASDCKK